MDKFILYILVTLILYKFNFLHLYLFRFQVFQDKQKFSQFLLYTAYTNT